MNDSFAAVLAISLAISLAACGGGGGNVESVRGSTGSSGSSIADSCATVSGGSTSTQFSTSGCINCAVTNGPNAIDNDLNTAATINIPTASVGSASFRATAQSGIVFPANNTVAVVLTAGPSESRVHVLTYLGGALQDDGTATGNTTATQNGVLTVGLRTKKSFDAVEFKLDAAMGGTQEAVQVRAFCSNANIPTV